MYFHNENNSKIQPLEVFKEKTLEWDEIIFKLQQSMDFVRTVKIHIIRHAETTLNAERLITGSLNPELSSQGEIQATNLGSKLDPYYDIAFCSKLKRTINTLDLATKTDQVKIRDIFCDSRLNERALGCLEGQKRKFIPEFFSGDLSYAPPEGESYDQVAKRIFSFLLDLSDFIIEKETSKILICGHAGIMRILVGIIQQFDDSAQVLKLSFSNTEVLTLSWCKLEIPPFLKKSFGV